MELSENWFIEGRIDFELQKYRLLAYLRDIESSFAAQRLYPPLNDLRQHYGALRGLIAHKKSLEEQFPKQITAIDLQRGRVQWERVRQAETEMDEVGEITSYAAGKMRQTLDNGTAIYESVVRRMAVEPIGINPEMQSQGYLLLCLGGTLETRAYRYCLTRLEFPRPAEIPLRLQYLGTWPLNLVNTPGAIKSELVRRSSVVHNPAAFALQTDLNMPVEETLLPVAKQVFSRYLGASAEAETLVSCMPVRSRGSSSGAE